MHSSDKSMKFVDTLPRPLIISVEKPELRKKGKEKLREELRKQGEINVPKLLEFDRLFKQRKPLAPTDAWKLLKHMWLKRCTKENRNLLIVIAGPTGSGKSWASLSLASKLDPSFTADRIMFTPQDLLRTVKMKLPPASVIILDEAQIGADHKRWFDKTVEAIRYVASTVRFKNHILIFTTPDVRFLEKDARELFHVGIQLTGNIDYKRKISEANIRVFDKADWLRDSPIFLMKPRIVRDGNVFTINKLYIKKPRNDLIEEYEKKKEEFTNSLYHRLELDLKNLAKKAIHIEDIVKEVLEDPVPYTNNKGEIVVHKLQYYFGISKDKANQVKIIVEDKQREERQKLKRQIEEEEKELKKAVNPEDFQI